VLCSNDAGSLRSARVYIRSWGLARDADLSNMQHAPHEQRASRTELHRQTGEQTAGSWHRHRALRMKGAYKTVLDFNQMVLCVSSNHCLCLARGRSIRQKVIADLMSTRLSKKSEESRMWLRPSMQI
jgi:hypothetical protein